MGNYLESFDKFKADLSEEVVKDTIKYKEYIEILDMLSDFRKDLNEAKNEYLLRGK
jgi:hypothetical protein